MVNIYKNTPNVKDILRTTKEIATNTGFFMKIKELIKLEKFFASYFKYNAS